MIIKQSERGDEVADLLIKANLYIKYFSVNTYFLFDTATKEQIHDQMQTIKRWKVFRSMLVEWGLEWAIINLSEMWMWDEFIENLRCLINWKKISLRASVRGCNNEKIDMSCHDSIPALFRHFVSLKHLNIHFFVNPIRRELATFIFPFEYFDQISYSFVP